MANRLFRELRAVCRERGVQGRDIAAWIDRSEAYVSQRLNGEPWTLTEMYTIMDKLQIPHEKLHIAFPPKGMWAGSLEDPPPTVEQELIGALQRMIKEAST